MTAWMNRGACREDDPELWFPEGESAKFEPQIDKAKRVCRSCPVMAECLEYALDNSMKGIWGGQTDDDRERTRRRRRWEREKAAAKAAVA